MCRRMATATYLPPPFYKDHSENRSYVPEPPSSIEGTYVCFGGNYIVTVHSLTFHLIKFSEDVLPNLEEQGVRCHRFIPKIQTLVCHSSKLESFT